MDKIPEILEGLKLALANLEAVMENSSVKDRPEVQVAKAKLMEIVRQEMASTADLEMSAKLAYPLLKQLQGTVPGFPFPEEKDEDDKK
jgi:hypothetical protein